MNNDFPACLWFSNQEQVTITDAPEVLDAVEAWLIESKASYRRYQPTEGMEQGRLDIYCTTEEHFKKIRAKFQAIRGLT